MAPNININEIIHEEDEEEENEPSADEYMVVLLDWQNNFHDVAQDVLSIYDPNYSRELQNAINEMPIYTIYLGCVNCRFPVAFANEIQSIVWSGFLGYNTSVGFVLRNHEYCLIRRNAIIGARRTVHWQTTVHCCNCSIQLSVIALTIYNQAIDEISSRDQEQLLILDAMSISFFQIERRFV